MDEKWIKDIQKRMAEAETPAPDGLWENIAERLQEKPAVAGKKKAAIVAVPWVWRTVSVAAMLAVVFVIARLVLLAPQPGIPQVANNAKTAPKPTTSEQAPAATPQPLVAAAQDVSPKEHRAYHIIYKEEKRAECTAPASLPTISTEEAEPMMLAAASGETESIETATPAAQETARTESVPVQAKRTALTPRTMMAQAEELRTSGTRLVLSAYTTGGLASSFSQKSTGVSDVTGVGPDDAEWEDDPQLGLGTFNQGREVETKVKHRQPVRVGVTVAYPINDRWSVETGLTYTRLHSDLRYGSASYYTDGHQKLNYIGIPLSTSYKLFSFKKLSIYASAGVLAEKCISGKREQNYVLADQKKASESEDIKTKPFQFSFNAAAGVQYHFVPSVSLFAEPGLSYYVKDGSSLSTIYKEKPLNLNLNFGIRVTIGK